MLYITTLVTVGVDPDSLKMYIITNSLKSAPSASHFGSDGVLLCSGARSTSMQVPPENERYPDFRSRPKWLIDLG
jgi:hypothetical protein